MEVAVLHWPDDVGEIEKCRARSLPRLLIAEAVSSFPDHVDALEDWMFAPVDPAELKARTRNLRRRATASGPSIDDNNVLHHAERSLALTKSDASIMGMLVDSFRSVVGREGLLAQLTDSPAQGRHLLDLRILRLRRRLVPLGLVIRTAWRKGYMLDVAAGSDDR